MKAHGIDTDTSDEIAFEQLEDLLDEIDIEVHTASEDWEVLSTYVEDGVVHIDIQPTEKPNTVLGLS
jgi:hypothetical protein